MLKRLWQKDPSLIYPIIIALNQLSFGWFASTYALFLTRKYGLTIGQFNVLNAAFFLTDFLFEIPTGALADRFGRKKVFITGQLIFATCLLELIAKLLLNKSECKPV